MIDDVLNGRKRREDFLNDLKNRVMERNPALYAFICDNLGEQPENDFYQRGEAELGRSIPHEVNLALFVIKGLSLDVDDISKDTRDKEYLLRHHFEDKFKFDSNNQVGQEFRVRYRRAQDKLYQT